MADVQVIPQAKTARVASTGPTQALAEFVSSIPRHGVPHKVREVLRMAVIDAVGCGLFGLTTPACKIVQEFSGEQGGPEQSTLWASGGKRVSAANAALSIGTAIHGFDFDDHSRAKIHPGAAVFPAAFALGELHGTDGATFLAAVAAGYETMNRVSLAANPNASRMKGWHLTGTTGTFGAAAAASVILGLDASATASALGLAGTQSAGLWAFNADGAMSKRLHPGRSAQSGIFAALLAQKGFQGPRQILEAPDGGFLAATSDDVRLAEIELELGSVWRTEGTCFKSYSCCGSNHSSVAAAIDLMTEHKFTSSQVRKVIVGVSRVVELQTGFVYRPTTVLNAQMSLRFDVAVALVDGQVLIDQFTERRIVDPIVCDLASRVEVEIDPEMDAVYPRLYAGVVTIELEDGRRFRKRVDYSRGMPENQMSDGEIHAKFTSLAGAAVRADDAAKLYERLKGIYEVASVAPDARAIGALRMQS